MDRDDDDDYSYYCIIDMMIFVFVCPRGPLRIIQKAIHTNFRRGSA